MAALQSKTLLAHGSKAVHSAGVSAMTISLVMPSFISDREAQEARKTIALHFDCWHQPTLMGILRFSTSAYFFNMFHGADIFKKLVFLSLDS